jgi:methylmalonyl-CoA mutase
LTTNSDPAGSLFSEFSPLSKAEWEELVRKQSEGEDYEKKLNWNTLEGFTVPSYCTPEDLANLKRKIQSPVQNSGQWTCTEPVFDAKPSDANLSVRKALEGGATACLIRTQVNIGEGILGSDLSGTQIQSQDDFNTLIHEIENEQFELIFDSGPASPALLAIAQNSSIPSGRVSFFFDPFSFIARHGRLPMPEENLTSLIRHLSDQSTSRILCADASFWHHCGATAVQETGISLAVLSEFLASAEPARRKKTAALCCMRMAAGPLYFPEIAKFRAIRQLWSQLLKAYEIEEDLPLTLFAETSRQTKSITDPHNNILRSVTEAMAAITGGADYLTIQPHNVLFEQPGDFSKRIARNIQHILREEAHFDKVADPAAGSYYIETVTDTIARKAWEFFQQIEKEGGFLQSLKNGLIQNEIRKSKKVKEKAYQTGKRVLVGTNTYPITQEPLPDKSAGTDFTTSLRESPFAFDTEKGCELKTLQTAFNEGALLGDVISSLFEPQKVLYQTIPEYRAGQIFDEIRLRTKHYSSKQGSKPLVQLVPAGDPKWRNARASFARNILGCAGFDIDSPSGFETIGEAAERLNQSRARLFVLCSSNREYDELVGPFCNEFGKRGLLALAGRPGEKEESWRNAGISYFIRKGMNLPDFLISLQNKLFDKQEGI